MKRAIIIRPGGYVDPVDLDIFSTELAGLQHLVGGYIEMVPHSVPNFTVYCNEDGKLRGMKINGLANALFSVPGDILVGPVVVLGPVDTEGDTLGLTEDQVAIFLAAEGEEILNALSRGRP